GGAAITSGSAPFTGTFAPQQAFSGFNGLNPNGNWNLNITDMANTDVGNLLNWEISFIDGNGLSYSWASSPSGFSYTAANPTATPSQTTTYTVTTSSAQGCSSPGSVAIT